MIPAPQPATPLCPRCGYDLSGAPSATSPATRGGGGGGQVEAPLQPGGGSTPTRGLCPECGLDFEWIDVLDPTRHEIRWLFEHTPRRQIGLQRAWSTLFRTLMPWRFWRSVTLTARISAARLLLWLVVLIVPLHGVWVAARGGREIWAARPGSLAFAATWIDLLGATAAYPLIEVSNLSGSATIRFAVPNSTFVLPLGATILAPVVLLVLARTRATSKVRMAHILRATVYSSGWIVGWYALWTSMATYAFVCDMTGWPTPATLLPSRWSPWHGRLVAAPVVSCLVWFAAYWYFAIARGMRLRRAALVWVLMMIACLLLGLNFAVLDPEFVQALFW